MLENSRVAAQLPASREGLISTELVSFMCYITSLSVSDGKMMNNGEFERIWMESVTS
jgi:hypothetical protein